ncbi:hypothetical protein, partial [Clostridium cibarium]|uniref:hypothetical protein n=1 Tax=Clostridium cibarium TaxID=2762247 RepID=UPI001A9B91A0
NISYVNIDFIIYLCTTIVIDILGCTSIFLAIVFINLILNKIITSSIIVFGVLTLIDAFVRVSKMNIMTINKILFYKSDFTNYHNKIFIHLSYIICFLIIGIFIYLLIINKSCSKDILYDEN